jgi:hypothetical protein
MKNILIQVPPFVNDFLSSAKAVPLHCLLKPPDSQADQQTRNEGHHHQVSTTSRSLHAKPGGRAGCTSECDMAKCDTVNKSHVA